MLKRLLLAWIAVWVPAIATAHPAPFTYVDLRVQGDAIDVTVVAHVFDLAHDLSIDDPARLLDSTVLDSRRADLLGLFTPRLTIGGAGAAPVVWSEVRPLEERQSVAISGKTRAGAGVIPVHAWLFPYDPAHQTFINVYEGGALTLQAILDASKTSLDYFPGSSSGVTAIFSRFVPEGARHVAGALDHWLFLIGLLLLGGTRPQIGRMVLAFVAADVLTTSLIALNVAHPAAKLTDPALALSIVYVGADNLMVRGGKDVRPWIAFAFGMLHGFWFGGALALMDLPRRALVWSLISYDLGSALAQVTIIVTLAMLVDLYRRRSSVSALRLAQAGSVVVVAGGVYLFVQRVFFPGGLL